MFAFIIASQMRTYYASDTRLDSIMYGCLLALGKNPYKNINNWEYKNRAITLILSTALMLICILIRNNTFRETLRYSLQGIALLPIFYYTISDPNSPAASILNSKILKTIGKYSYSIYLIHYILIENLSDSTIPKPFQYIISPLLAWMYAMAIDRYIDKPISKTRRKFR